jgi:putative phosphoribosyl transferase
VRRFRDRSDAGRQLAERLRNVSLTDPIVLGLPRGGMPVAWEVADVLKAPLDVFVARKIGVPGFEEFGIAAIAEGSDELIVGATATRLGYEVDRIIALAEAERPELDRRVEAYRHGRALPELAGHDVILVDDGLATGVTAEAALYALRERHPARLILAVPPCARDSAQRLAGVADKVVCVLMPAEFHAVAEWYEQFPQVTDEEVTDCLLHSETAP